MKKAAPIFIVYLLLVTLSISLGMHSTYGSALVWTDKPDYIPGDTAIISGSGFFAYATVTITITYPDSTVHTIYAWTDGSGAFNCPYPLNGITGTYTVTATDGTNTAPPITFTDKATVTLDQTYNDQDPTDDIPDGSYSWGGGGINTQNSILTEGNFPPPYPPAIPGHVNYRMIIDSLPAGTYTIVIEYEFTKGGIAAFDFLTTSYDIFGTELKIDLPGSAADRAAYSAIIDAGVTDAEQFSLDTFVVPSGLGGGAVSARQAAHDIAFAGLNPRTLRIYGAATIGNIVQNAHTGPVTGDSKASVNVTITKTSAAAAPILLTWGGHIAIGQPYPVGYGVGHGAASITGGPFHMYLNNIYDAAGNEAVSSGKNVNVQLGAVFVAGRKGGYKYDDKTGNGPSIDDTPLNGWTIQLYKWINGAWSLQTNAMTGTSPWPTGYYEFVGLGPGDYKVVEVLQSGWTCTSPNPAQYLFTVTSGFEDLNNNFYNFHPTSTTTTLLSATSITLGQSITDTATVAGNGLTPTGSVDFQVSTDGVNFAKFGNTKTLVSGSATSDSYTPPAVGTYYFRAVYSGDSTYPSSQSGDAAEPLTVSSAPPAPSTTTTLLSATTITLGHSVTDTVTVTGSGPVPTGSVTFQVQFGAGSFATFSTKSLDATGHATSDAYTPSAVGSYHFRALYGGDGNYQASQSADDAEPLTVGAATPGISTLLSSSSITLGQSVTDSVTVTGLGGSYPVPTGDVDFQVKFNGGSWTTFDADVALDSSGEATSDSYTPLAVGSYYFRAVYAGDSNYSGSSSGDTAEPLTVNKASSTTTTELSAATITLGQSVHDHVTVTGLGGSFLTPTGTVDFQVSFNGGAWTTFDAAVALSGGAATSADYTPLAAGSYWFRAIYSGDSNYLGSQSANDAEPLTVSSAPPGPSTTTTLLSVTTITLGQTVHDHATVTGSGSTPTGTVQFYVKAPGGSFETLGSSVALVGGAASSIDYTPLATGTYYFKAVYAGDSNYSGSSSGDTAEPLTVTPAGSTTTTELSATSIVLGQSVHDHVHVAGLGGSYPVPTGTVQFYVKAPGGSFETLGSSVALDANGDASSIDYTPLATGTYYFKAVYAGDSNYSGSSSGDTAEPLTVSSAPPGPSTTTTLLSATTITLGHSVTDTVTVTGSGPVPTGSVTFQVQFGAGSFATFSTKSLDPTTGKATSDAYTPSAVGSYHFRALYGGDGNYQASQSADDAEPLTVDPATPTVSTTLSQMSITLGQSITDAVTVTGLGGSYPVPTGTVTFYVKVPSSAMFVQFGAVKTLSGGLATSDSYTPEAVGTYYFKAVYGGDSNYNSAASGDTAEPLAVGTATPGVSTLLSSSSITLGHSVTDLVAVTGLGGSFPGPTGTVDFQVSADNKVTWTKFGATKTLSGGSATSDSYTPLAVGTYYFRAVYSGDSNYSGKTSTNEEKLTVSVAPPPPVGGEWVPMNKSTLLGPWISLSSIMALLTASFVYVKRKKKQMN